jgi:hypothetical protein
LIPSYHQQLEAPSMRFSTERYGNYTRWGQYTKDAQFLVYEKNDLLHLNTCAEKALSCLE